MSHSSAEMYDSRAVRTAVTSSYSRPWMHRSSTQRTTKSAMHRSSTQRTTKSAMHRSSTQRTTKSANQLQRRIVRIDGSQRTHIIWPRTAAVQSGAYPVTRPSCCPVPRYASGQVPRG
ncbi:hypothetical protein BU16DRAFT_532446 [Lophium mytilinum]|uniref:Uncharacterized protein n=1 Tax=Lophium mytilinum TaxID=390894 RepID=A0A6A6RB44_9PEZI|nr:hypothetical protein BU16DRAFT_532446 [Lophium mytilinum]